MTVKRSAALMTWLCAVSLGLIAAAWSVAAQDQNRKFIVHEASKPIADFEFEDAEGRLHSLADFHGKIVLLNIWATWCVPCRKEMPTLERLHVALGGPDFEVVALSIDRSTDAIRKFFAEVSIQKLAIYRDSSARAMRQLGVMGLPTTLLIDREGLEIGRLIGPAEWDAPDIAEFVGCVISETTAARSKAETKPAAARCGKHSVDVPAGRPRSNIQP